LIVWFGAYIQSPVIDITATSQNQTVSHAMKEDVANEAGQMVFVLKTAKQQSDSILAAPMYGTKMNWGISLKTAPMTRSTHAPIKGSSMNLMLLRSTVA
jgi:hypothetical protein